MDWKNLKQLKGKNVQVYTQEFRRRALLLGVDLHSQDTLLKYIGGLHTYLRHTILMFNPTSLDEVCVQATHLEARGKQNFDGNEENEFKGNWKKKRNENVRKEKGKLFCKRYSKTSHDEDHCCKLHPELKLEIFKAKEKAKEKGKIVAIAEQYLGSD